VFPHKEKIAADLAALVEVPVPAVQIDKVDGHQGHHAISALHGSESVDATLLEERLKERYRSPEVQDAFRKACGLLPFHAWVATEDHKNDHLVVSQTQSGEYRVAAIDFAFSMNFPETGGSVGPSGPPALVANVDKAVIEATVQRIETTTDEQIRNVVNALPDELVNRADKDKLIAGLLVRRGKIREAMKQQGWLS
jgi:hypothetical protein